MNNIKSLILDILYPKFCIRCKKEGFYLCEDCLYLIEVLDRQYCPFCFPAKSSTGTCPECRKNHHLDGLYFACSYQNPTVKKLIHEFKNDPFVKDYCELLAFFLISHLANLKKVFSDFYEFIVIPVPLSIKKKKARGYNQAEEIAKQFSKYLKLEMLADVLIKSDDKKNSFRVENSKRIKGKKVILIDDVFITGATMDECAKVLKEKGAEKIFGMAIARGN